MKPSAIIAIIEDRSPYPLQSLTRTPGGYIAIIGTRTPDDQDAVCSIAISELEIIQNDEAQAHALVESRVDHAAASLGRYVESFVPAPKWDELAWGP